MMNIKNETIKKLTTEEGLTLGFMDEHIVYIKGTPKTRLKGLKTTLKTETEIHYEGEHVRYELLKTSDEDGRQYALRYYNKDEQKYNWFPILLACEFMR